MELLLSVRGEALRAAPFSPRFGEKAEARARDRPLALRIFWSSRTMFLLVEKQFDTRTGATRQAPVCLEATRHKLSFQLMPQAVLSLKKVHASCVKKESFSTCLFFNPSWRLQAAPWVGNVYDSGVSFAYPDATPRSTKASVRLASAGGKEA